MDFDFNNVSTAAPTTSKKEQQPHQALHMRARQTLLDNHKDIPVDLRDIPQWVLWRSERNAKTPTKPIKMPYSINGRRASSTDPATWSSYTKVLDIFQASERYSGIGFVLSKSSGVVIADIDGCIEGNEIEPDADDMISFFATYTEISPSGTGLRIIMRGTLDKAIKTPAIEIYNDVRYMTITGDVVMERGIESRQPEIDEIIAKYTKKTQEKPAKKISKNKEGIGTPLGENEKQKRLSKALRNQKFKDLFNGKGKKYCKEGATRSEEDGVFLAQLYFWFSGDADAMDDVYRQSKLYREKWDRNAGQNMTYGQRSIKTIIEKAETEGWEVYTDGKTTDADDREIIDKVVTEINATATLMPGKNKSYVWEISKDIDGNDQMRAISLGSYRDLYQNARVELKKKEAHRVDLWMEHKDRHTARSRVFDTREPWGYIEKHGVGFLNGYRGLARAPVQNDALVDYIRQNYFLDILCDGDKAAEKYVWRWLSRMFQVPGEPALTALTFRGAYGTGKSTLSYICETIFGPHHSVSITDLDRMLGRFNSIILDKVFVGMEESLWGGNKAQASKLKDRITAKRMIFEEKNVDAMSVPNVMHLCFFTNEDWTCNLLENDRRYFPIKVSERMKYDKNNRKQKEFWDDLYDKLNDQGGIEALLWAWLHEDISDFNPRYFPETADMKVQRRLTENVHLEWLEWFLEYSQKTMFKNDEIVLPQETAGYSGGDITEGVGFYSDFIYDNYCEFLSRKKHGNPKAKHPTFGKWMSEHGVTIRNRRRVLGIRKTVYFFKLSDVLDVINDKYGEA